MNATQLAGCRVVVTRPVEQAEELARPLRERGADVRVRPLVRITPPADPAPLHEALARLEAFDLLVFTSANAVRAVAGLRPPGAPAWPPAACVGEATARTARELGLRVDLVPPTFTAEALALELRTRGWAEGRRVLWPRASGARPTIAELLRGAGALVTSAEAYRTDPDPAAAVRLGLELEAAPADVLVFTSPSAVRAYAEHAGVPPCVIAAIGTVTRDAALQRGMQVALVPAVHTVDGLLTAVERWYRNERHTEQGSP